MQGQAGQGRAGKGRQGKARQGARGSRAKMSCVTSLVIGFACNSQTSRSLHWSLNEHMTSIPHTACHRQPVSFNNSQNTVRTPCHFYLFWFWFCLFSWTDKHTFPVLNSCYELGIALWYMMPQILLNCPYFLQSRSFSDIFSSHPDFITANVISFLAYKFPVTELGQLL